MRRIFLALVLLSCLHICQPAWAQNQGFSINRYEPTAAGEWSFAVDHPWYSKTRYFAAGVTMNYAHNPLVIGVAGQQPGPFSSDTTLIEHQLIGHIDLAGSFLDRVLIVASLPIVLLERGNALVGVTPITSPAVSDPRFGLRVRLYGQHYRSPFAISLSADLWVPINSFSNPAPFPTQVGESGVRVLPKIILGGLARRIMWSFTAGFYYRPDQSIGGTAPGFNNTTGSSINFGAAIAYADLEHRFAVGPEATFNTVVTGDQKLQRQVTSLEVLLGVHYNIARLFQIGVAGGIGALREPGTPDGRVLLRLAYAPMPAEKPKDRDLDGVPDKLDLCPDEPQGAHPDPQKPGCPLRDQDADGVFDPDDQCVSEPAGPHPDPQKPGCPLHDQDGDGVLDADDQCVSEPAGPHPDPKKPGCPLLDRDGDGVPDLEDQCVEMPAGPNPDPQRLGCPDLDTDGDGVFDSKDQCKTVPAGANPDPDKPGCPLPDRDKDLIPDRSDACPDQPGAPSPDPKRNGCPGLVTVSKGMIVILQQVFFATNKDIILQKSFPVLDAVAEVFKQVSQIKRVAIEGHTDDKGKADYNRDLSDRRAKSVMKYLTDHGVDFARLEARGYGPDRPLVPNINEKNRALNRRVEFRIVDPAPGQLQTTGAGPDVVETPSALPDAGPVGNKGKKPIKGKGPAGPQKPTPQKPIKKGSPAPKPK